MTFVYIAHPVGGDIQTNLADLRRIIRAINLRFPSVVPLCSYYADVVSLDDTNPDERARGIKNANAVLRSKLISEVWLTGGWISPGMEQERQLADGLGIKVVNHVGKF